MPIFLKNGKAHLFIHIPKTGGSSLEDAMKQNGYQELFSVRGIHPDKLKFFRATPQHLHAALLEQFFNFDDFDSVFAVCRNPFDRLKSEYYWQRTQGQTQASVKQWWCRVRDIYLNDAFCFDNHLRPQNEFLVKSSKFHLFKLEDSGIDRALELLHVPKIQSTSIFRFPVRKVHKKRSIKDSVIEGEFLDLYDEVQEFYYEDYQILGYPL